MCSQQLCQLLLGGCLADGICQLLKEDTSLQPLLLMLAVKMMLLPSTYIYTVSLLLGLLDFSSLAQSTKYSPGTLDLGSKIKCVHYSLSCRLVDHAMNTWGCLRDHWSSATNTCSSLKCDLARLEGIIGLAQGSVNY